MKINGKLYLEMARSAACCLDNNKDTINNLNVFPVPDGDTGINMSLTMSALRGEIAEENCESAEKASQYVSNVMLRSARGNSGVILSLFFRGIAKAWKGVDEATLEDIINGLNRGVKEAYRAVMNPTEGTILTVMRVMAETAEKSVEDKVAGDIVPLFMVMYEAARQTLEKTPEMLPQLKAANVVDSGGFGFLCVIEGMQKCLNGTPVLSENKADTPSGADFSALDTESIKYSYCTECIVTKNKKYKGEGTSEALHKFIMSIGDSAVFVDDEEIIKLHVHTNNPGKVITEALRFGSLYTVKIENMKLQHSNLSEKKEEAEEVAKKKEYGKKFGFVSVCQGEGLAEVFRDMAVDEVVSGGQTMNPSTEDIIEAIEKVDAENVFVLPNNKNICMVCEQAERILSERNIYIVTTLSVPEGISAIFAFDETLSPEDNQKSMTQAAKNVTTVSVTYAVRDTEVDGKEIKEGDTLGLVNGKIKASNENRIECIKALLETLECEPAIITVYKGEGSSDEEAESIAALLSEKYPDADCVTIDGGQAVYSYMISLE